METPDRPAINPDHRQNTKLKDQLLPSTRDRGGFGFRRFPKQTITTITDRVLEGLSEWQNRPLDVPPELPRSIAKTGCSAVSESFAR